MKKVYFILIIILFIISIYLYRNYFITHIIESELTLDSSSETLKIDQSSKFYNSLHFISPIKDDSSVKEFSSIGQIIAQIEPSGFLLGHQSVRVDLSAELSKELHLDPYSKEIGSALGIVEVPEYISDKIKIGDSIVIYYYAIRQEKGEGIIIDKYNRKDGKIVFLFKIKNGKNWYPGANCEILFPNISFQPYQIPNSSIIHYNKNDYIYTKNNNGDIIEKKISVLFENKEYFVVLGLQDTDKVLIERAILLKPIFHRFKRSQRLR